MKDLLLFFLHPALFYKRMLTNQPKRYSSYILYMLLSYTIIYIIWGIQIGPLFETHYSRFLLKDKTLDIPISLCLNLAVDVFFSLIVYFTSKAFGLQRKLTHILLSVFSLEMISIVLMSSQLCVYYTFGQIPYIYFWESIAFSWQMFCLFIAVRILFDIKTSRAILIQFTSIAILLMAIWVSGIYHRDVMQQGLWYMKNSEYGKAANKFNMGAQQEPSNAKYYFYLGEAYRYDLVDNLDRKSEVFEKSKTAYIKSLSLDPKLLDARIGLGYLYSLNYNYEDSLTEFKAVITCDPGRRSIYREIGNIYLEIGRTELARENFLLWSGNKHMQKSFQRKYYFRRVDKIKLLDNRYVTIESAFTWHVVDPVLYEGSMGDEKLAESRIHDFYYEILLKEIYANEQVVKVVDGNVRTRIIAECNQSKLMKYFGIEIVDLNLYDIKLRDSVGPP